MLQDDPRNQPSAGTILRSSFSAQSSRFLVRLFWGHSLNKLLCDNCHPRLWEFKGHLTKHPCALGQMFSAESRGAWLLQKPYLADTPGAHNLREDIEQRDQLACQCQEPTPGKVRLLDSSGDPCSNESSVVSRTWRTKAAMAHKGWPVASLSALPHPLLVFPLALHPSPSITFFPTLLNAKISTFAPSRKHHSQVLL